MRHAMARNIVQGAALVVAVVAMSAWGFKARAASDLSRQTPVEVRVQLGDEKGARRFMASENTHRKIKWILVTQQSLFGRILDLLG